VEQTAIEKSDFDLATNRRTPPVEIALTIRKAINILRPERCESEGGRLNESIIKSASNHCLARA